jgi:indole-3-glycerol phosphate synthase
MNDRIRHERISRAFQADSILLCTGMMRQADLINIYALAEALRILSEFPEISITHEDIKRLLDEWLLERGL